VAIDIPDKMMEPRDLSQLTLPDRVVVKKLIDSWRPGETSLLPQFDRRIFLVRDPRDVLISRLLYNVFRSEAFRDDRNVAAFLALLRRKVRDPRGVSVLELVRLSDRLRGTDALKYHKLRLQVSVNMYRRHRELFHLYTYEDFVERRQATLQAYLGATLPEDIEVDARYSRVKRSSGAGAWRQWFTPEDKAFFDRFYARYFRTFGYAAGPLDPEPVIPEETSVGYVLRLADEHRSARNLPAYRERDWRSLFRAPAFFRSP